MAWIIGLVLTAIAVAFLAMVYYDQNKRRQERAASGEVAGSKTRARIILASVSLVFLVIAVFFTVLSQPR